MQAFSYFISDLSTIFGFAGRQVSQGSSIDREFEHCARWAALVDRHLSPTWFGGNSSLATTYSKVQNTCPDVILLS